MLQSQMKTKNHNKNWIEWKSKWTSKFIMKQTSNFLPQSKYLQLG